MQFAKVAKIPRLIKLAKDDDDIPLEAYDDCFTIYNQVLWELSATITNQNLGAYRDLPSMYKAPVCKMSTVEKTASAGHNGNMGGSAGNGGGGRKRSGDLMQSLRPHPRGGSTKGFVVYKKPGVWRQPPNLLTTYCHNFVQEGKECGYAREGKE